MSDDTLKIIGYTFNDPGLLRQALTHPSYLNEIRNSGDSDYQRLEFLGDAVLGLALADILSELNPGLNEGELSLLRASLADQPRLASLAADNGIGSRIFLGRGEEQSGGREKPSILSDVFEALLGAIYTESGFISARETVVRLYAQLLESREDGALQSDPKSELQERLAASRKPLPVYELLGEEGPPHDRQFRVAVFVDGSCLGEGEGRSKKAAQQAAAKAALQKLKAIL